MKNTMKHAILICAVLSLASAAGAQIMKEGENTAADTGMAANTNTDANAWSSRETKRINIELADEPALVLGRLKITLGQAMEWAVKQNFDMMSVSYDVAMVDTQYNQFLKKFAPMLSAEGGGSYVSFTPGGRSFTGENQSSFKGGASLYKSFSSGTTVVAGLNHEYDRIKRDQSLFSSMTGPARAHKPSVFISVQQELLRNAFGFSDRETEEILKNASKMKKEAIIFQLSLVIVQVIGEYWNTVITKVSLENADLQVKETKKVRDITARNAAYGLADDYTMRMYNAMLAGAEANMTMTRQKYREALRSFLTTINVDENMDVTGTAVFSNKYPAVNVEEALKTAYQKRADYRNAVLNLETANMMIKVARNGSLPSLTAEFNAALNSEHGRITSAYGQIGSFLFPGMEGKLKLSYPIGDKDIYTQERNARFKVRQAEIQLEKYKRTVKDDIMNATDNIETSFRIYQKAMEARKQSELFYRGMLRDLGLGRLNSAVVKNGLDAIVESRERELQALVGYNIALLQFDVARNILFEKYNIDVDKYIPKDVQK